MNDRLIRREEALGRCGIVRVLDGFAYAANGNLHNPTPKFYYSVTYAGRTVGVTVSYKSACEMAAAFEAAPEW